MDWQNDNGVNRATGANGRTYSYAYKPGYSYVELRATTGFIPGTARLNFHNYESAREVAEFIENNLVAMESSNVSN
jgi:hypothetical protein